MIHHAQPRHQRMALALLLLLALGVSAVWINKGREHYFPDAPNGQFNCLSYTPRGNDTDTEEQKRQHIRDDLKQLSERTHCVRTYAIAGAMDEVPKVARQLGMKVLLGLWIGNTFAANEIEIKRGIEVANANRDVIEAVIVGNEVLLRREQDAPAIAQMLQRVHDATQLPVTYADVWDFWLKNPSLADSASFVTIHILPFWDDIPISVDHAMEHMDEIYKIIQAKFPGKHIYVGETGWPSVGRQREGAAPSLVNQARFTREFIAFANARNLPSNFIEAYDQPWKKKLEGTVGGYWGLYDAEGHAKFPLTGAVVEDLHWWRGLVLGCVVTILCVGIAWLKKVRAVSVLAGYALAGYVLGAFAPWQWEYWSTANRDWHEWTGEVIWGSACNLLLMSALLPRSSYGKVTTILIKYIEAIVVFGVAYINIGLMFEGRYRDFPIMFLALPTVTMLIARLNFSSEQSVGSSLHPLYRAMFCLWMLVSAVVIVWIEKFTNQQAVTWCICCLLFAWTLLPRLRDKNFVETQTQI